MMKLKKAAAIGLCALLVAAQGSMAFAASFPDVPKSHWASTYIEELSSRNIIRGFSDGTFRPQEFVNKHQAIALMVGMLGVTAGEKAQYMGVYGDYLDKMGVPIWVQPDMAVALGRGILFENEISGVMLNREQFSLFLARSYRIGKTNVNIALNGMKFTDKMTIDRLAVPAIYELNQHGIINGMGDGTFNPKGAITRAATAKMLSIADKKLLKPSAEVIGGNVVFDKSKTTEVSGEISSVNIIGTKAHVTLKTNSTTRKIFIIDTYTDLQKDGKKISVSDLKTGQDMKIVLDRKGLVISAYAGQYGDKIKGKITYKNTSRGVLEIKDTDDDKHSYKVDVSEVKVYIDGDRQEFKDLDRDDWVYIEFKDGEVYEIKTTDGETKGEVYKVDHSGSWNLEIKDDDGDKHEYPVDKDVDVEIDGRDKDFDDLERGDEVEFEFNSDGEIDKIEAKRDDDDGLEVYKVDHSGSWNLEVKDEDGDKHEYPVDKDVDVEIDGRDKDFDDLKRGYKVEIEFNRDDEIDKIEAKTDDDLVDEGTVYDVDSTGSWNLTIKDDDGDKHEYKVDKDVDVEIDGKDKDFDDLEKGYEVELKFNKDDEIDEIEAKSDDKEVDEGEITDIDKTGKLHLTVEYKDDKYRYEVDDDVDVEIDGKDADFDDLEEGYEVELKYDSKGRIDEIEAESDDKEVDEGEIKDIDKTGKLHLTVEYKDDEYRYEVDDDVDVEIDGKDADFDDLEEGYEVELKYDSKGRIDEIEAKSAGKLIEKGTITHVDSTSEWHLKVEDKNNVEREYPVDKDVDVELNDKEIDFDELQVGYEVELDYNRDDEIDEIKAEGEVKAKAYSGYILEIDDGSNGSIKIITEDGDIKEFDVDDDEVDIANSGKDFDDLELGYKIDLAVEVDEITDIEITDDDLKFYKGDVDSIDEDKEEITVDVDGDSDDLDVEIKSSTDIYDNDGDEQDFDDIDRNDDVIVIGEESGSDFEAEIIIIED